MGTRGPAPKPKSTAPKLNAGVPEPSEHLTPIARAEYVRAADELEQSGADLCQVDFAVLETYAVAYAEALQFTQTLQRDGRTVVLPNGITALHPLCGELAAARRTLLQCCRLLGFAPTERSKLKKREARGAENPFTGFIK